MIRRCVAHPKYVRGEPNNDLQICFLAESIKQAKGIMIPCLTDTQIKLNDGDIVVTESRTNFNKGKTEGYPMRTHIPISGKYSQGKTDKERGRIFIQLYIVLFFEFEYVITTAVQQKFHFK